MNELEQRLRAATQDEKKKELESQLSKARAKRDLADAKEVLINFQNNASLWLLVFNKMSMMNAMISLSTMTEANTSYIFLTQHIVTIVLG